MGQSERKATYHLLLGLLGALVMGALLVVVVVMLMRPMAAAQANQQRAHANKEDQNKKAVRVSAAGENNFPRAKGDENSMVYKSVDSRSGCDGGFYSHVMRCEPGYKAIGGGWDFNNTGGKTYWDILPSRPGNEHGEDAPPRGETWVVDAYGATTISDKTLPKFTAYAACAPQELLSGLSYVSKGPIIGELETKTIRATCGTDERVMGYQTLFTKPPKLTFRALLDSDGARDVRFERVLAGYS